MFTPMPDTILIALINGAARIIEKLIDYAQTKTKKVQNSQAEAVGEEGVRKSS
jgi:hypothetical protein